MVTISQIESSALVPDQMPAYAHAVSGLEYEICGDCVLYTIESEAVLVAYPHENPLDQTALDEAVAMAVQKRGLKNLTVLSASRPSIAPQDAAIKTDNYWFLHLPAPAPAQKTRNMLNRAAKGTRISLEEWGDEHAALCQDFLKRKKMDDGTNYIFAHLADYLAAVPEAALFCARTPALAGMAIADFSSLNTAFYMFAMRSPIAAPGTADLLLKAIIDEAAKRGFSIINLGLGIDSGIEFFKKKWGATPDLPYIETSWTIKKPGILKRLFGGNK